jgi:hypothetical protein
MTKGSALMDFQLIHAIRFTAGQSKVAAEARLRRLCPTCATEIVESTAPHHREALMLQSAGCLRDACALSSCEQARASDTG